MTFYIVFKACLPRSPTHSLSSISPFCPLSPLSAPMYPGRGLWDNRKERGGGLPASDGCHGDPPLHARRQGHNLQAPFLHPAPGKRLLPEIRGTGLPPKCFIFTETSEIRFSFL